MSLRHHLQRVRRALGHGQARQDKKPPRCSAWYRPKLELLEVRLAPTIDYTTFASALYTQLTTVQSTIHDTLNTAAQLPIVNKQLGDVDKAKVLVDSVLTPLKTAVAALSAPAQKDIQNAIQGALGGLLGDTNGDGKPGQATDVLVTPATGAITDRVEIEVLLHQGTTLSTTALNVDLGLSSLPLKFTSTGGAQAKVG